MDENIVVTPVTVPAATSVAPAAPAKQSRWKSAILWSAIIAQVIAILQLTGAFKAIGLDAGYVGNITATVLQLLVIIGVVNNPENPTSI
jgi:uncharacterized membrane protein